MGIVLRAIALDGEGELYGFVVAGFGAGLVFAEVDPAGVALEDVAVVGDYYDRRPVFFVEPGEEPHYAVGGFGIEVAGGFVRQDELRGVEDGAGDGYALLLAAGELVGHLVRLGAHADRPEHFVDALEDCVAVFPAGAAEHEFEIVPYGAVHQEPEVLEDHAHLAAEGGDRPGPDALESDAADLAVVEHAEEQVAALSEDEDEEYEDLLLRPDPSTLSVLPWRPQEGCVIRFYCDLYTRNGEAYPYGARKFLKDTIAECREMGFSCRIGLKSEFYLFKTDEDGNPTNIPWDNGGYLDVAPLDKGENIRREICLCLEEMGIQPESSYHEYGPGQNEIDFRAADALKTADNFITYKNVVSNIAARNGVCASFTAKPLKGKSGNGLHLYMSFNKGGIDLSEEKPEIIEAFLAGLIKRMRDITVFLNTQEESYLRFGENEAPKYITWSEKNGSRLLRVSVKDGRKKGFILRSPDSAINPYLAFAFVLQAGLEGVKAKESLPPAQERTSRHFKEEDARFEKLPLSLDEAIDSAVHSDFIQNEKRKAIANSFIKRLMDR